MVADEITGELLATWRRHNDILLYLLQEIPLGGLAALPAGTTRGRDVARQFFHLDRVRRIWLTFHETGKRGTQPRAHKGPPPTKAALRKLLAGSGRDVEDYLREAFLRDARIRMFGGSAVLWMGYLIAHESHHRGQIVLALKQSGKKLSNDVAIAGLWGKWYRGDEKTTRRSMDREGTA